MNTALRAIMCGAWREQWNQGWRFSRGKLGLWLLLLQTGSVALLLGRLAPSSADSVTLPVTTVAIVGGVGGQVVGLLRAREALYGRSVLRNLHASPASGASILAGLTLAGLPSVLGSSLYVAVTVAWLLRAGSLWWTVPLLWGMTLVACLAGYVSAIFAVVSWVRLSPSSLALLWGIAVVVAFGLVTTLIGLVTLRLPLSVAMTTLRPAAHWLVAGMGGLVGGPGLLLGLWLLVRPERAGEWYREAYLRMREWSDSRRQVRSSHWPRLLPGPAGALQAGLWREIWLNWFTWVRFAFMLLTLSLLFWRPGGFSRMARLFPIPVILGFGLIAAFGSWGELLASMGGSDGPNIGLSLVAGIRARNVVAGKWVATLPFAVISAMVTAGVARIAGQPGLALSLAAGLVGLGAGVVAMAGGLFDLDPLGVATEQEVPPILRAFLEQFPRRTGGICGYVGGICFAAGAVWLCQRTPSALLPLALVCAAAAHLVLVGGYVHLRRLGL